ncbi:MAG TPA: glycosyl hydrolase family 18 protein [Gemmatimonadaceae bacterium]|nr:glycosyl hydrolase family 18 protein [Gemmatimonadaceae bacterium]
MVEPLRNAAPRLAAVAAFLFLLACAAGRVTEAESRDELWGFAAPWDARSDSSLARHASALEVAVSGWIELDSATAAPRLAYPDTARLPSSTRRFAIVTSWHRDRFHPRGIAALASDGIRLAAVASAVGAIVGRHNYQGLVLDLEGHEPSERDQLRAVVAAIADSARAHGAEVIAMAIPAVDTAGYPARLLARHVDYLAPMLYDLHWSGSSPGPVTSASWARDALALRVREIGPERLVVALPAYGYHWRRGIPGQTIGFHDARSLTARAGTTLARDAASGQLTARFADGELWVGDAAQFATLRDMARSLGVRRVAIWRLGLEDPALWARPPR